VKKGKEKPMKKQVFIQLEGKPVAWKRPGQSGVYRYDVQRAIKNDLGFKILESLGKHTSFTKGVQLNATLVYPTPRSMSKKQALMLHGKYHTLKPDLDNCLKFYLDLCKEVGIYEDDSQVYEIHATKLWGLEGYVQLTFTEI
jgi:Holliday junction resolvase RusA-like endonuclease